MHVSNSLEAAYLHFLHIDFKSFSCYPDNKLHHVCDIKVLSG